MKTNEKKNTSAKKKLIPAVAMLTTSAVMLSTATYAWFTMSREVEVTGIKLTATTPQTIEISLGDGTGNTLKEPGTDDTLWMNSVATGSVYSEFGKLIPASSIDGGSLFYTTSAVDLGRAVNFDGENSPFTAVGENMAKTVTKGKSASQGDDVNASNTKNTEGYYLDIPVWFRTTSSTDVDLGVVATFEATKDEGKTDEKLYKAARVSIIKADNAGATSTSTGVISGDDASYYDVDKAVAAAATSKSDAYAAVDKVVQCEIDTNKQVTNAKSATTVATVAAVANGKTGYSDATKYYIRVWLEGEDQACWNGTASQSFNINLQFYDLSNTAN